MLPDTALRPCAVSVNGSCCHGKECLVDVLGLIDTPGSAILLCCDLSSSNGLYTKYGNFEEA